MAIGTLFGLALVWVLIYVVTGGSSLWAWLACLAIVGVRLVVLLAVLYEESRMARQIPPSDDAEEAPAGDREDLSPAQRRLMSGGR